MLKDLISRVYDEAFPESWVFVLECLKPLEISLMKPARAFYLDADQLVVMHKDKIDLMCLLA